MVMPMAVLVVSGAPLARRLGDMAGAMVEAGWDTYVIGTPASSVWIPPQVSAELGVRFDFRKPEHPKKTPGADVVVVCPATFNTVNKIALGLADNYAVSVVCEAIGGGTPTVVAPMVNQKLWGHFQWAVALEALRQADVRLMDPQNGRAEAEPVQSGTGDAIVAAFQPSWLVSAAGSLL